jgi:hypothetical protein
MEIFTFIICGLATYRITRLITRDTILSSPREKWWKRFPPESTKLGYLITCEWCLSFWIASLVYISAMIISVLVLVYSVFALSAIAGLLTAYEDK